MPTQKYRTKDGQVVPGVTTVIGRNLGWSKDALMYWAWDKGMEGEDFRKSSQAAADAGTIAHALAESDVTGRPYDIPAGTPDEIVAKARAAFSSYMRWKVMSKLVLTESEIPLVSEQHRYGGTIDALGTVNGSPVLVDFKTSNGLYADHVIQCSAYAHLLRELRNTELLGGVHILRFSRDGGHFHHHCYTADAVAPAFAAFLRLRELHDLRKVLEGMV